jgi:hypothetical protein
MSRSTRKPKATRTHESAGVTVEIPSEKAELARGIPQTRARGRKSEPPFSEFLPRVRVGRLRTVEDWLKEFGRVYRAVRRGEICTQDGSRLAYMAVSGKAMAEAVQQMKILAGVREEVIRSRLARGESISDLLTFDPGAPQESRP